jgi:uncharacterized protein (UPF0210 family)
MEVTIKEETSLKIREVIKGITGYDCNSKEVDDIIKNIAEPLLSDILPQLKPIKKMIKKMIKKIVKENKL